MTPGSPIQEGLANWTVIYIARSDEHSTSQPSIGYTQETRFVVKRQGAVVDVDKRIGKVSTLSYEGHVDADATAPDSTNLGRPGPQAPQLPFVKRPSI